eukprot:78348_1
MMSEMQMPSDRISSISYGFDPTDSDIDWFDINSDVFELESSDNTTLKTNSYIVLLDVAAYDLTHYLFFLGHYLPLQQRPDLAKHFQKLFKFVSQFEHGANRVNLRNLVKSMHVMRQRLVMLGNPEQTMEELDSINQIFGYDIRNATAMSRRIRRNKTSTA